GICCQKPLKAERRSGMRSMRTLAFGALIRLFLSASEPPPEIRKWWFGSRTARSGALSGLIITTVLWALLLLALYFPSGRWPIRKRGRLFARSWLRTAGGRSSLRRLAGRITRRPRLI